MNPDEVRVNERKRLADALRVRASQTFEAAGREALEGGRATNQVGGIRGEGDSQHCDSIEEERLWHDRGRDSC